MHAGQKLLALVDEGDLGTVRSFSSPPSMVAVVLANVHCLLGLPEDWQTVRCTLRSVNGFLQQLRELDIAKVTKTQVQTIRRKVNRHPGAFNPETVEPISSACAVLSRWINVVCERVERQGQLHEDVASLLSLKKEAVTELRSFSRPPVLVAAVLGNVQCLLGLGEDWKNVKANIRSPAAFLHQLHYFVQASITPPMLQRMRRRRHMCPDSFKPDALTSVSNTCAVLCQWVIAVCQRAGLCFPADSAKTKKESRSQLCVDILNTAVLTTEVSSEVSTESLTDSGEVGFATPPRPLGAAAGIPFSAKMVFQANCEHDTEFDLLGPTPNRGCASSTASTDDGHSLTSRSTPPSSSRSCSKSDTLVTATSPCAARCQNSAVATIGRRLSIREEKRHRAENPHAGFSAVRRRSLPGAMVSHHPSGKGWQARALAELVGDTSSRPASECCNLHLAASEHPMPIRRSRSPEFGTRDQECEFAMDNKVVGFPLQLQSYLPEG